MSSTVGGAELNLYAYFEAINSSVGREPSSTEALPEMSSTVEGAELNLYVYFEAINSLTV